MTIETDPDPSYWQLLALDAEQALRDKGGVVQDPPKFPPGIDVTNEDGAAYWRARWERARK